MIKKNVFLLLALLMLISCQDSTRTKEIEKKINDVSNSYQNLQTEFNTLYRDMENIWVESLKYRFPDLVEVKKDPILLNQKHLAREGINFLKSISIDYLGEGKLKAVYTFYCPTETPRPRFLLYLFDIEGINICREEITYKDPDIFKIRKRGYLPANKDVTQDTEFNMYGERIPIYLIIRKAP